MGVYFIESVISIRWNRFDEQKQLIRWTVISVLTVYDLIYCRRLECPSFEPVTFQPKSSSICNRTLPTGFGHFHGCTQLGVSLLHRRPTLPGLPRFKAMSDIFISRPLEPIERSIDVLRPKKKRKTTFIKEGFNYQYDVCVIGGGIVVSVFAAIHSFIHSLTGSACFSIQLQCYVFWCNGTFIDSIKMVSLDHVASYLCHI